MNNILIKKQKAKKILIINIAIHITMMIIEILGLVFLLSDFGLAGWLVAFIPAIIEFTFGTWLMAKSAFDHNNDSYLTTAGFVLMIPLCQPVSIYFWIRDFISKFKQMELDEKRKAIKAKGE